MESRILLTVWKSEYVNQETVEGECNPICMRPETVIQTVSILNKPDYIKFNLRINI